VGLAGRERSSKRILKRGDAKQEVVGIGCNGSHLRRGVRVDRLPCMNRPVLLMSVIFALLFAGGFGIGRLTKSGQATSSSAKADPEQAVGSETGKRPQPASSSSLRFGVLSTQERSEPSFREAVAAEADLGARFRAARSGASSQRRQQDVRLWASDLLAEEIHSAMALVASMPGRRDREWAMRAVVARWGAVDAPGALSYVVAMANGPEKERLLAGVVEGMAAVSPETAVAALRQLPEAARVAALPQVLREMAARDPGAALRLHAELTVAGTSLSKATLRGIFQEWAATDPAGALRASLGLEDTGYQQTVIDQWAYENPTAAARAAMGDPRLLARAMEAWARDDPRAASGYVASLSDPGMRSGAARAVARSWARASPVEAAAWAGAGPSAEGMDRGHLLGEVVQQWVPKDPDATGRWLETLPQDLSRDVAVRYYAWKIEDMDAGAAVQWASTIRQEQLRVTQQETAARAWLKQDEPAARAWIAGSNLSSEAKTRLLVSAAPPR